MDAAGCARLLEDRFAHGHVPCPRREGSEMRTVVVDKIASVTQACGLRQRGARRHRQLPAEEGVVVVVEVLTNKSTLQHARAHQRPHGQGRARATSSSGALGHRKALFGYSGHVPDEREARRHHADAEHRRRARHLRLGESRQGQAVRLPRASAACCDFPYLGERIGVPARVGYRQLDYDATLDTQRRAGRRARRHLHGGRQDGRRVRDHLAACGIAASSSTRSRRRAFPCAATSWRSKMPARATRSSSPTSASSRPRARWARR